MRRKILSSVILCMLLMLIISPILAVSPTILLFTANIETISLEIAESGEEVIIFSWMTFGVTNERILLHQYIDQNWEEYIPLAIDFVSLPVVGTMTIPMRDSQNFNPLTYRLSIIDENDVVIAEQILVIPYASEPDQSPRIDLFATNLLALNREELARRETRIPIRWQVTNRLPTSNIQFFQKLETGEILPVELPRDHLWFSSSGRDVLVPILPTNEDESVNIIMRVVDLVSGVEYDRAEISLDVSDSAFASVTGTPSPIDLGKQSTNPRGITTTGVNIRSGPSTEFSILGSLPQNTELIVLAITSNGGWYKVQSANDEGWVTVDALDVFGDPGELPVEDGSPLFVPATATPTVTPPSQITPTAIPASNG